MRKHPSVLAIVIALLLPGTCMAINDPPQGGGTVTGDWTVMGVQSYKDVTIVLDGNLSVNSLSTLILDNVTLLINCSFSGEHTIDILPGGMLKTFNGTTIASSNPAPDTRYCLRVRQNAFLDLRDSHIDHCGFDSLVLENTGLLLESGFSTIQNVSFSNNYRAIILQNCSADITNCSFQNDQEGVCAINASANVTGCDFTSLDGWAVQATVGSNVTVTGCTVTGDVGGSSNGTFSEHSRLAIAGCAFSDGYQGIAGRFSTISLENSSIANFSHSPVFLMGSAYMDSLNSTFNQTAVQMFDSCWLNVSWVVDIHAAMESGGDAALAWAHVSETPGLLVISDRLDGAGWLRGLKLREYDRTKDVRLNRTPHSVNVTQGNSWNLTTVEVRSGLELALTLDDVVPAIVISSPANGTLTNESSVFLEGTAADNGTGLVRVQARVDGGAWTQAAGLESWNITLPLDHGIHTIEARALDRMGNAGAAAVELSVDLSAPLLTVTEPADGIYTNSSIIWVAGTSEPGATVNVNGRSAAVNATDGKWAASVSLTEGNNTITVESRDTAGNLASTALRVFLDTVIPFINLTEPADNSYWNKSFVMVAGSTEPGSLVYIADKVVRAEDGSFRDVVLLSEGANAVNISVRDRAGNTNARALTLHLDQSRPFIELDSYTTLTKAPDVLLSGRVETGAELSVDDAHIIVTNGTFSTYVQLSSGSNTIILTARDRAGNSNTTTIRITRDRVPPAVMVTTPEEGMVVNTATLLFTGEAVDDFSLLRVEWSLDGNNWFCCTGKEHWNQDLSLGAGVNRFLFRATDAAGNINTTSRSITRDTSLPALKITRPGPGAALKAGKLAVSGTAYDQYGLSSVSISKDNRTWVPCKGTDGWSGNLTLSAGNTKIYVRAYDLAGNVNYNSISVNIEKESQDAAGGVLVVVGVVIALGVLAYLWQASQPSMAARGRRRIQKVACPNCGAMILRTSEKCPRCRIVFQDDEEE